MFESSIFQPLAGIPVSIDFRVLVVGLLVLPFVATYLTTKATQILRQRQGGKDVDPPPMTYWIPFIGNTIEFATDTRRFLTKVGYVRRLEAKGGSRTTHVVPLLSSPLATAWQAH